jgi:hypothetical protein
MSTHSSDTTAPLAPRTAPIGRLTFQDCLHQLHCPCIDTLTPVHGILIGHLTLKDDDTMLPQQSGSSHPLMHNHITEEQNYQTVLCLI